jgi:peptidoglycan-associated lipoprotein
MRRAFLLIAPVLALALTGCPAKPKEGECKTSEDCADQKGYGPVCVQGRCEECGQDTDCKAGFVCRANKCVPRPECERDADCPGGKTCEAGRCVAAPPKAECSGDADCGAGKACEAGRCVTARPMAAPAPECPSDGRYESVYFDFDKALIRSDGESALQKAADCIKKQDTQAIVVEGNCDERGTVEYNLHLGQRRAESAKKYLQRLGVKAKIKAVSFGKEKPVCAEHDESCWQRNRRGDVRAQ